MKQLAPPPEPPNVLWNPEIRNVVLVDFERSEISKQVQVLQEISSNRKRKHLYPTDGASCSGGPHQRFIDSIGYRAQNIG
jgi:hypothetical protein